MVKLPNDDQFSSGRPSSTANIIHSGRPAYFTGSSWNSYPEHHWSITSLSALRTSGRHRGVPLRMGKPSTSTLAAAIFPVERYSKLMLHFHPLPTRRDWFSSSRGLMQPYLVAGRRVSQSDGGYNDSASRVDTVWQDRPTSGFMN